jgi:hypothetical protein
MAAETSASAAPRAAALRHPRTRLPRFRAGPAFLRCAGDRRCPARRPRNGNRLGDRRLQRRGDVVDAETAVAEARPLPLRLCSHASSIQPPFRAPSRSCIGQGGQGPALLRHRPQGTERLLCRRRHDLCRHQHGRLSRQRFQAGPERHLHHHFHAERHGQPVAQGLRIVGGRAAITRPPLARIGDRPCPCCPVLPMIECPCERGSGSRPNIIG